MKTWISTFAAVAATIGFAASAHAATTVIGSSNASDCANAAQHGRSDRAAIDFCNAALRDDNLTLRDRAKTFINHGVMLMRQLNWTEALQDFDRSIALQSDIGEAYVNRGAVMIGLHRYQEGLDLINHGLELGIEDPAKAYYNRGLAHEGLENARDAYLDYQQAVTLSPHWDLPQQQLLRFTVVRH
jgi:tetratricopeptide (TPR) repeat protein